jgi:hypothetical protein
MLRTAADSIIVFNDCKVILLHYTENLIMASAFVCLDLGSFFDVLGKLVLVQAE